MRPRGDLGHDAAIRLMGAVLTDNRLRKNAAVAGHQRRGTVVARGLKAKDYTHFAAGPLP